MFIKSLDKIEEFSAGDSSRLREILHPQKAELNLRYSLAHATVDAHTKTKLHSLKTSEVYHIISGAGVMTVDKESHAVGAGDTVYIPPMAKQYIENNADEPLVFLCIVDPAWREEDETIFD